jgi:hypothetical protein
LHFEAADAAGVPEVDVGAGRGGGEDGSSM